MRTKLNIKRADSCTDDGLLKLKSKKEVLLIVLIRKDGLQINRNKDGIEDE